jgi:hypothetical protein
MKDKLEKALIAAAKAFIAAMENGNDDELRGFVFEGEAGLVEFLMDSFNTKQTWKVHDLENFLASHGFSMAKARLVKDSLLIRARKDTDQDWVWWVPGDWKYLRKDVE